MRSFSLPPLVPLLLGIAVYSLSLPVFSGTYFPEMVRAKKYLPVINSVKDAWLALDQAPAPSEEKRRIRKSLRQSMILLYETEHKAATANWIKGLDDVTLSKKIQKQRERGAVDFDPINQYKFELASIDPNGCLRLSAGYSTATHVPVTSPYYDEIMKYVGPIEPGYRKEISPVPLRLKHAEHIRQLPKTKTK